MIAEQIALQKQKENEKKARRWATLILLLLLFFLIFPLMSGKIQAKQRFEKVVRVEFDPPPQVFSQNSSSERSSTKPSSAIMDAPEETPPPPSEAVEEPIEQPKPVVEPVEKPKPMEKIEPLAPTVAPSILTDNSSSIDMEVAEMIGQISDNAQVSQVNAQMTEVTEAVSQESEDRISDFFSQTNGSGGGKVSDSGSSSSNTPGEGDSGSSDSGDADTDGQGDSGNGGDDFDGNGLLTRKVIKRANVTGMIKQTGKIVINLCVNREGKVIFAEADMMKSTLKNPSLLAKAENTAARYRYEKDYTVAERQCGKLSFIFKVEKE